jgi:RimJ/RimL family protein N-acetyltransferase
LPTCDSQTYRIRPFRRSDRPAVREICIASAWMGRPGGERIPDEWIWAEYWTRYFTDRQPRHAWVVERRTDGRVVGYLTGTPDVRHFDRYVPFLLPGIALRVIRRRLLRRPASRRAIFCLLRSLKAGEMRLPGCVARHCPAAFHMNLLPEARRRGLGLRLFETFRNRMRSLGVGGIHAQTLSRNEPIQRFCRRAGFRLLAATALHAFGHIDLEPMHLLTWALPL